MTRWATIPSAPRYEVGDDGRVRRGETILRPWLSRGYPSVKLYTGDRYIVRLVHRLVALAFIPNPDGLPQINHRDEVRTNNRADNLEWCTARYNVNYGSAIARRRLLADARRGVGCPGLQKRLGRYRDGELIAEWPSLTDAHRETGIPIGRISEACTGIIKRCRGDEWRYL